ncbi:MAG: Hsp20/alpha crystallin family protein [Treponema sp.]|nr:Hsp20/alpha crystallin family protein [Treponema sp.]
MKTITYYRPNTIQNIMNEFDNCLESLDSLLPPATRIFNHVPAVDVRESEGSYILEMELPGYDEKNIDVHVDGANLTIASKQESIEEKNTDNDGVYLIKERRISSFSRSFKLPQNANPETVSASFKNGVLSLEIKKRAEAQKRAILINAA